MAMLRLDKLLADTGRYTRRESKQLIREGRVLVDGRVARTAEEKVSPEEHTVTVDGEAILHRRFTWVMLHKPAGVLSATEDSRQKTVLDLLPQELRRQELFPVGRLDKDTEGLLLLTNDGETAHRLLSPKYHVEKRYLAHTEGCLQEADRLAFAEGIVLGDGTQCRRAKLEILQATEQGSRCIVTVHEGKFHQVKRMLAGRGCPVVYLKRLSMGGVTLDDRLAPGEYRLLSAQEELLLRRETGDAGEKEGTLDGF